MCTIRFNYAWDDIENESGKGQWERGEFKGFCLI